MSRDEYAVELIRLFSASEDYTGLRCPDCQGRLVVHQPDERLPERLLGTCRCCFNWFLIDAGGRLMLRLPDEEALRGVGAASGEEECGRTTGGFHRLDRPGEVRDKRRPGPRKSPRTERSPNGHGPN